MSVKDLLNNIMSGDKESADTTFEQLMSDKIMTAIETKREEMTSTMFGESKSPYEKGKDKFEADKEMEKAENDEEDADKENGDGGDSEDDKKSDDSDDSEEDSDDKDEDDKDEVKDKPSFKSFKK